MRPFQAIQTALATLSVGSSLRLVDQMRGQELFVSQALGKCSRKV